MVPFTGLNSNYQGTWLNIFEYETSLMNLLDQQKIICAKKLLSGKGKLFTISKGKIYACKKLKKVMLSEFGDVKN